MNKFIEFLKWSIKTMISAFKQRYPLITKGVYLLLGAIPTKYLMSSAIIVKIDKSYSLGIIDTLSLDISSIDYFGSAISALCALMGVLLIMHQLKSISNAARLTSRVLINGIDSSSKTFPDSIIPDSEKLTIREVVELGYNENIDVDLFIDNAIEIFNAEVKVDIFNRFILNNNCKKLYLGGLQRIPFLIAYGSRFRANIDEVKFYDKIHNNSRWSLMDEMDDGISIIQSELVLPNDKGDIGVAIGLTNPIQEHQLPNLLKDHTIFISPNVSPKHNLVMNQENINRLTLEIKELVSEISRVENVNKIHFFVSAQSSIAISLGMRYQDGIHKNWVIHNFDAPTGTYTWAIELDKIGIKKFKQS
ncbi:SAVED domain-containing protein [Shewanella salipaludis]|uniref:SAVED domain-containing protein n=1 Tax=Shewanella salipaludis TaxID=2723052 RepID=A0A972FXH6_9GAMM|nr:SAVED domain-containing protein [Shewanella salipaludis]